MSKPSPSIAAMMLSAPLLALLAIPLITLLSQLESLKWLLFSPSARGAQEALLLSLETSAVSVSLISLMGTPLAWLLASRSGPWQSLLKVIIMAPMFLPPSIVGLTLLSALNREGWLGSISEVFSTLPFTESAVIIAQITVSAPLYILGAFAAFKRIDPSLIEVARTLGLSPWGAWWKVTLPLLLPGLLVALSLSWARALGEFGATILFAGLLPGVTETAPLAIYLELEKGTMGAIAISIGLVTYMLPLFGVLAWLSREERASRVSP